MSIVNRIRVAFDSQEALAEFINDNARELFQYFNATNRYLDDGQEVWYELVLKHTKELRLLDYENRYIKAFIVNLLDYACRFGQSAMVNALVQIVQAKRIVLSKRLEAEIKLFYPKPSRNNDLIERFGSFYKRLQEAWNEGEIDIRNTKAALLHYYKYVLENLPSASVAQFRTEVDAELGNFTILGLISDVVHSPDMDGDDIQKEIDHALERNDAPIVAAAFGKNLIETDTDYAKEVNERITDFNSLRNLARDMAPANRQMHQRGIEIINNEVDLLVYMSNYGKMHYAKVHSALDEPFPVITDKIDIIDWGCGQAIATLAFIEKFGNANINMIVLIEPSELALKRAALHCRKFAPNANVITICKKFDDITPDELPMRTSDTSVNMFSNILDMESFSQPHLIELIEARLSNRNFFVCASPYKDDVATARLDAFKSYFEQAYRAGFRMYHDVENSSYGTYWMCNVQYTYGKSKHGSSQYCLDYDPETGCRNKWKRVLKVFSVG